MRLRDADAHDADLLWVMLTHAASMSPGGAASVAEAEADDALRGYVEGWPREDDLGVVAVDDAGAAVGAAWLRSPGPAEGAVPVATADAPEIAIAVTPSARGRGVGTRLLDALVRRAEARHPAVVLSVRVGNPAVRLYERAGFVVERRITNRVGGESLVMRRASRAKARAFDVVVGATIADDELEALLVEAYAAGGHTTATLAATVFAPEAVRARGTLVGAFEHGSGALLGTIVLVDATSAACQIAREGELELHLLAVREAARGRGVGRALVQAGVDAARRAGRARVVLSTQPAMTAAQALYAASGFERAPARDWTRGARPFLAYELELGALRAGEQPPAR